jgi:hypothetical protein
MYWNHNMLFLKTNLEKKELKKMIVYIDKDVLKLWKTKQFVKI